MAVAGLFLAFVVTCLHPGSSWGQSRNIQFTNNCPNDIWIAPLTNANGPPPPEGIQYAPSGSQVTYTIDDNNGWAGRFWPKMGCDGSGQNCQVGQSVPPCPSGGCQPPSDTKVEFFFPSASDNGNQVWYDISLVDGYSLPVEINPSTQTDSCVVTNCALSLDSCPSNENSGLGDLHVYENGQAVSCLSPCKRWNYPPPYGLGNSEQQDPGLHYCCPTPPIYPTECRQGPVVSTQYVNLIHSTCPSAYSYAYDDEGGLHTCPVSTSFAVTFCQ